MRIHLYLNNCGGNASPNAGIIDGRIGSPAMPIFQHIATPADVHDTAYGAPQYTTPGVICGYCCDDTDLVARCGPARHATPRHVYACHTAVERAIADHAAEWPLVRAGIL